MCMTVKTMNSKDYCMFGRAAYFAEKLAYSHKGYCHNPDGMPGLAQLLLVRVACGLIQVGQRRTNLNPGVATP